MKRLRGSHISMISNCERRINIHSCRVYLIKIPRIKCHGIRHFSSHESDVCAVIDCDMSRFWDAIELDDVLSNNKFVPLKYKYLLGAMIRKNLSKHAQCIETLYQHIAGK